MARITIFQIKLIHTLIFWVLSACVLYALFSGVMDRITTWTWVAAGLVVLEGVCGTTYLVALVVIILRVFR